MGVYDKFRAGAQPGVERIDVALKTPVRFSLGSVKPMPGLPFGSTANAAFGAPGNGDSTSSQVR